MPPKRKRTGEHPPPLKPAGPRQSSRRTRESPPVKNEPATMVASVRKKSERGVGSDNHQDQPPGIWDSREGVEQAMKELSEMEHKLQNAVRKQRLAVESSDLSVEEKPEDAALRLEPYVPAKRSINQTFDYDPDGMGQAPLDGYEADVAMGDIEEAKVDENESNTIDRGARRPPAINSDQLPLPWTGRLGYVSRPLSAKALLACLNTYLRTANPPVFSSRTCRISSIIDHRHPLKDPSQPGHPTKNRPDKKQLPSHERGQEYVQELGLANARDIVKMLRWNNKYGIKFMRLSSEMFPFASHAEYGYKLAPFASEVLAEAGKVAAELGHRLTTHPGQFTQIGSPRNEVVISALRDLEYHDELLSLLKLPEEMDRDAVMILHMGGTYGDKAATLDRFRKNYAKLSDSVKRRLVLENDDVAWSVHDLLPVCEELNIPLVLDFHHHNIIFDPSLREGTLDIMQLFDRIKKTWTRKGIRQKMHYSEPTAAAVTPRDRRKHSPRVKTLPPCAKDMDLMIEAKDKEQAVFELMRTFKLPGWDLFNNIIPFERDDESRKAVKKKKAKKGRKNGKKTGEVDRKLDGARNSDKDEDGNKEGTIEGGEDDDIEIPERIVNDEDFGMGGPENRVYWPEGMDEWLRPKKREVKTGKTKDEE